MSVRRMLIRPNLGMVFPASRRVPLAGEPFRVKEMQLLHVASYERAMTRIAWRLGLLDGPPRPQDSDAEALLAWNADRVRNATQWPPSTNSSAFVAASSTPEGVAWFVRMMVRRFDRNFGMGRAVEVAGSMRGGEWRALNRVAYGGQEWEGDDPASKGSDDGPNPTDWPEVMNTLVARLGMTFEEAGRVYVSQLRLLNSGDGTQWATIRPFGAAAQGNR